MTIEQLAEEMGITKQAIFNRIARSGENIESFSSGKQGKSWILTEQGCQKIRAMMRGTGKKRQQAKENESTAAIAEVKEELERQKRRAAQFQGLYKSSQQTIKAQADIMTGQVKMLQQHTKAIDALNRSIQAQAITLAAQTRMIEELQEKTKKLIAVQVTEQETQKIESGSDGKKKKTKKEKRKNLIDRIFRR